MTEDRAVRWPNAVCGGWLAAMVAVGAPAGAAAAEPPGVLDEPGALEDPGAGDPEPELSDEPEMPAEPEAEMPAEPEPEMPAGPAEPVPAPTSSRAPVVQRPTPPAPPARAVSPSTTTSTSTSTTTSTSTSTSQPDPPPELHADGDAEGAKPKTDLPHQGTIIDVRLGAIGCIKTICKRHDARPGFRIDGMFGTNIKGWVDIGLAAGWGALKAGVEPGTNALSLYGLDPAALPPEAMMALDLSQFVVNDARLDTLQVGPNVRVHFIPRGRVDPYVGTGVGYTLFRARYDTDGGRTRLGFHGIYVPLQAGLAVFVHKNVAIGAQFDWLFTWYGAVSVRGAPGKFGAPISKLKDQAAMGGTRLPGDLPMFWTAGGVVHLRFGK